jgi:hypothetical protein
MESFNKERGTMLEKIERFAAEIAKKEKDLTTITYKIE